MTTSLPARVFTKDDWCWFSGAECWPNGDEPVIREIGELKPYTVSACYGNVEAYWSGCEAAHVFRFPVVFPTQKAAIAFLNGLPDDFEPEAYGFRLEIYGLKAY